MSEQHPDATSQESAQRIGICLNDYEQFWWRADDNEPCPACSLEDEEYQAEHIFLRQGPDPPRPLGHDTSIDFSLGEKWGDKINVRIDGNGIKVVGGNRLAVIPNASNVVYIETVKS